MIPKDPMILLSYINTQLRDHYPTLRELCTDLEIDFLDLVQTLQVIDHGYDAEQNRFRFIDNHGKKG